MAVFRIEKTRDYTVMSNHHLRNAGLSLKSKGLLSMILFLPEDWNYITRSPSKICKDGTDRIGSVLKALERAGYIVCNRIRDSKDKIMDGEYVIYKTPHPPDTGQPCEDEPDTACPDTETPDMDNPYPERGDASAGRNLSVCCLPLFDSFINYSMIEGIILICNSKYSSQSPPVSVRRMPLISVVPLRWS